MIWYPRRPRWMNVIAKPFLLCLSTPGGGFAGYLGFVPREMSDLGRTAPPRAATESSSGATTRSSSGIG